MRNLIPFLAAALLVIPTFVGARVQSQSLASALLDAAAAGQTELMKSLLDNGANVEAKNKLGATALIFAAVKGHPQVVQLLLDRRANVNAKTTTGITPLIAAAAAGHAEVIELLLQKGADVSAKDQQGRTALNMAEAIGDRQVYALLKSVDKIAGTAPVPVAGPTGQANTEVIRAADRPAGLTVRAGPSPQARIIAYLPVGSTVKYTGELSNGWVKLSEPTHGGWVDQNYVGSRNPEASVVSVDSPEQCLRVRGGPGTDREKVGCLPRGARLKLSGAVQNGWAQIVAPMAGWVTTRQIQAPGLFPPTQATTGVKKERRQQSQGTGYRRQQSDGDSDFERAEREFDEEIDQFRRENEEAQVAPQSVPARGVLRIGPLGVGIGFR